MSIRIDGGKEPVVEEPVVEEPVVEEPVDTKKAKSSKK